MEKISTKEEVILHYLQDKYNLVMAIRTRAISPSIEVRDAILDLGDPHIVTAYAIHMDACPLPDTRLIACKSAEHAYIYSQELDNRVPRVDTREAASKSPQYAYFYAAYIDQIPTTITREGAYKHEEWKEWYQSWERRYQKRSQQKKK